MLKRILSNWHYGIKARVVDGALLAKFDTALEPTLLRLDLERVQANTLSVRAAEGDYELGLAGYKMDFVPLARFDARDAAEAAQRSIECALFGGARTRRFRGALAATCGVGVGVALSLAIIAVMFGTALGGAVSGLQAPAMSTPLAAGGAGNIDPAMLQALQAMHGGTGLPAGLAAGIGAVGGIPTAPSGEPGVPMTADDFLRQTGGGK